MERRDKPGSHPVKRTVTLIRSEPGKTVQAMEVRDLQRFRKTSDDNSGPQNAKKVTASQQNIPAALLRASKYQSDSKEQQKKEEAVAKWLGCPGLPATTVEDEDLVLMMETVDREADRSREN
ncbi:hypothetical protein SRHO_G00140500 [Serrasalmus rhombeus]